MNKDLLPKILLIDIETAPILGYVWGLWENTLALNQVKSDWHLLSFSAKWYTNDKGITFGPHNKIIYKDQRNEKDVSNDKKLLLEIWKLLNECDILLTQNGIAFDSKKINARFILNGMKPPSPYRHIDTKKIASKHFAFTSNKLEYMTDKLCQKYKKQKNAGFSMWVNCLKGDKKAFKQMETYNKYDIYSLEELYNKLAVWDTSINFGVYHNIPVQMCQCGSRKLQKRGYTYSNVGKFQRYICLDCSSWFSGKVNLLTKSKKASLLKKI